MAPNNPLPCWGNTATMNMNSMILTNIQASPYFKNVLIQKKTYHQIIDEIYHQVNHLEPWEKGSRKLAGQTGMCGGVRGVGTGGVVSSAFCLLYKLYTLKLTRNQLNGLLNHVDSPYIRGVGFLYVRYTIAPQDLWYWMEGYLEDEESIDPRAGGGCPTTVGEMVKTMLTKLEWYGTLFPRIPVTAEKTLREQLKDYEKEARCSGYDEDYEEEKIPSARSSSRRSRSPAGARESDRRDSPKEDRSRRHSPEERSTHFSSDDRSYSRHRDRSRERDRKGGRDRNSHRRDYDRDRYRRSGESEDGKSRDDHRREGERSFERRDRDDDRRYRESDRRRRGDSDYEDGRDRRKKPVYHR